MLTTDKHCKYLISHMLVLYILVFYGVVFKQQFNIPVMKGHKLYSLKKDLRLSLLGRRVVVFKKIKHITWWLQLSDNKKTFVFHLLIGVLWNWFYCLNYSAVQTHALTMKCLQCVFYELFKGATWLYKPVGSAGASLWIISNMLHIRDPFLKITKYLQII